MSGLASPPPRQDRYPAEPGVEGAAFSPVRLLKRPAPVSPSSIGGSALLTSTDLDCLLDTLAIPDSGRSLVRHVRSSPPARTVGRSRGKPWFTFASRKMRRGIQAESGSVEFAACYVYEADEGVLEFWDQPTVLNVRYPHADGRGSGGTTTPDYLVIERVGIRLDERKQDPRLPRPPHHTPHIYPCART